MYLVGINFIIKLSIPNPNDISLQLVMDKKINRNMLLEKENDHKNVNKRDNEPMNKIDRLLLIKKISGLEDKETKELRILRNSKEVRANSRSLTEKLPRHQLKPLFQPLTNTQQYCQLYARSLLQHSEEEVQPLGSFLLAHDIDKNLRARMLDWMIEVTSSYKFSSKTYFASVHIMDRYFKAEDQRLPITKLHIIGVVAMLISTKMDEVYPLKVKTVYDKIVHKKIQKRELVEMQARIAHKLGFTLNVWSFYDLALLKLHQNWQAKNQEVLKDIQEICQHIAKFVVFNYQLYGHYSVQVLAQALLKAACKIYGSERTRLAIGDRGELESSRDEQVCLELILDTVRGYRNTHKNLNNIFKFADEGTILRVQEFFKNY